MARRKLIEYLNDPSLLRSISEEEMIAWAAEVPYAGLVQRLLAQKLAIEASESNIKDTANTMAILSSANPDKTIRSIEDFKQLMLSGDQNIADETEDNKSILPDSGHSVSDRGLLEEEPMDHELVHVDEESPSGELFDTDNITHQKEEFTDYQTNGASSPENMSSFSNWLSGLKPIDSPSTDEGYQLELADKQLASDTFAELLVSQGHYKRAIAMYEILMLKNPQKSSFFADQIEKLKAL